jgi:ABC-type uncharacterized transport system permease subunit
MNAEFLDGVLRLAIPLFTASLAAFCYQRIGMVNLAMDGAIALAAIGYVIGSHDGSVFSGIVFAVLFTGVIGAVLVNLKEERGYDQYLVGLALLYICNGLSRSLCAGFFGNPQYAYLSEYRLGDRTAMVISIAIGVAVLVSFLILRTLRLASILGSSRDLATIQGLRILGLCYVHNLIASLLIALTAIYLVEHGGSFTAQISGQRGFIALAIVTISGRSIVALVFWSVLFAVAQKFLYTASRFPGELVEASPYLFAIVVLIGKYWTKRFFQRKQAFARKKLPQYPVGEHA